MYKRVRVPASIASGTRGCRYKIPCNCKYDCQIFFREHALVGFSTRFIKNNWVTRRNSKRKL